MNRSAVFALGAVALGLATAPISASIAASSATHASSAALRTQSFSVEKMTCATCPIAVKTAMQRVAGVRSVNVDFETKTATVMFDPKRTNARAIAAASTNAGYPAKPAS